MITDKSFQKPVALLIVKNGHRCDPSNLQVAAVFQALWIVCNRSMWIPRTKRSTTKITAPTRAWTAKRFMLTFS